MTKNKEPLKLTTEEAAALPVERKDGTIFLILLDTEDLERVTARGAWYVHKGTKGGFYARRNLANRKWNCFIGGWCRPLRTCKLTTSTATV